MVSIVIRHQLSVKVVKEFVGNWKTNKIKWYVKNVENSGQKSLLLSKLRFFDSLTLQYFTYSIDIIISMPNINILVLNQKTLKEYSIFASPNMTQVLFYMISDILVLKTQQKANNIDPGYVLNPTRHSSTLIILRKSFKVNSIFHMQTYFSS